MRKKARSSALELRLFEPGEQVLERLERADFPVHVEGVTKRIADRGMPARGRNPDKPAFRPVHHRLSFRIYLFHTILTCVSVRSCNRCGV